MFQHFGVRLFIAHFIVRLLVDIWFGLLNIMVASWNIIFIVLIALPIVRLLPIVRALNIVRVLGMVGVLNVLRFQFIRLLVHIIFRTPNIILVLFYMDIWVPWIIMSILAMLVNLYIPILGCILWVLDVLFIIRIIKIIHIISLNKIIWLGTHKWLLPWIQEIIDRSIRIVLVLDLATFMVIYVFKITSFTIDLILILYQVILMSLFLVLMRINTTQIIFVRLLVINYFIIVFTNSSM